MSKILPIVKTVYFRLKAKLKIKVLIIIGLILLIIFFGLGWIFNRSAFCSVPFLNVSCASTLTPSSNTTFNNIENPVASTELSPDWSNKDVAKGEGFEIEYDAKPHEYIYPLDNELDRSVQVKNTGNSAIELQFNVVIQSSKGELGTTPFPQVHAFHLNPGESQTIYALLDWNELPSLPSKDGYEYKTVVKVFPSRNEAETQTAILTNRVKSLTSGFSRSLPSNAVISGVVKADGKPATNAHINIFVQNLQTAYHADADANGFFSIPVYAHKMVELGNYLNYNVSVSAPGYNDFNRAVTPKEGDNLKLEINLTKQTEKASYEVIAKYDIKLNIHSAAASKDGKYIAVAPFHTVDLPADFNKAENAYLYFFNSDGKLLWKYRLNGQTPTADVSDDGQYIATIIESPLDVEPAWGKVGVFDNKGKLIWDFSDGILGPGPALPGHPKSDRLVLATVKFSHNGQYLAVGDAGGSFNLLNTATHQSIWEANIGEGMIRNIQFEADDSIIYVSGANGYLYAYKNNGQFIWRTFVGAWIYKMAISKNYILTATKNGYFIHLLDKNGKIIWKAFVPHVGFQVAIAPDESYMAWFSEAARANVNVFNKNGVLNFFIPPGANSGTISDDGKYLVLTGVDGNKAYVKLITKDGSALWSTDFDSATQHPVGGYAWISPDKTRIVATAGEHIYFLKGGIQ